MTKRIISELFYLILACIGAIFILAFLMLLTFAGRLNNKFLKVLIFENFIENPFQGIFALSFILAFVITFARQKKLKFSSYFPNYILIVTGFGLLYYFTKFIFNAQGMKEVMISEKFFTNIKYYNCEIILLTSLLLIVGFITIKTILKTKEIHNA